MGERKLGLLYDGRGNRGSPIPCFLRSDELPFLWTSGCWFTLGVPTGRREIGFCADSFGGGSGDDAAALGAGTTVSTEIFDIFEAFSSVGWSFTRTAAFVSALFSGSALNSDPFKSSPNLMGSPLG